jgi:hypothetical protein
MKCEDAEILICDYATLASAARFELERHLEVCPGCAELARDSAAALDFMSRAADVEPPPELITKILYDAPWRKVQRQTRFAGWFGKLISPVLQPRFAMSMAMTVLSLSIMARFVPVRQLRPADLKPTEVWASLENRAAMTWARTVKFYENLKLVYQIQTTLREWQQDEEQKPASKPAVSQPDEHKLPIQQQPTDAAHRSGE